MFCVYPADPKAGSGAVEEAPGSSPESEAAFVPSLKSLNTTLQRALLQLHRELDVVTSLDSFHEKGVRADKNDRRAAAGAPAPHAAYGAKLPSYLDSQPLWEPSTEEARRLAQ